jgi:2Fe-2S ferredoxin
VAKVRFKKPQPYNDFEAEVGTPLMAALLAHKVPVASSCLGEGVCCKCRIQIISGAENLSAETALEKNLKVKNKISDQFRISCQSKILGDITIDADYW